MKNSGFTLIELVVVMAVITILFVIAVAGLSSIQSSQRDTAREHIASLINQQIDEYENTHNSSLPSNVGFVGSNNNYFINLSQSCPESGLSVNGTCVKMSGLTYFSTYIATTGSGNPCPSKAPANLIKTTGLTLCWDSSVGNGGVNGYKLGVYLESKSLYWVSQ